MMSRGIPQNDFWTIDYENGENVLIMFFSFPSNSDITLDLDRNNLFISAHSDHGESIGSHEKQYHIC